MAGSLAVTWLFTVMACSMETDAVAAAAPASQLGSAAHSAPGGGDSPDDACCQVQAGAIVSFNAVKLPQAAMLPALVPVVLLLASSALVEPLQIPAVPDRDALRRRSELLVHSLQAQAPPR